MWNFVHSVYGAELGFSSHEEEGIEEAGDTGVVGHIDVGGGVGGVSPVSSSDLQLLPPTILHSSPSESLHSAQTSNDDPDQLQVSLMPTKQSVNPLTHASIRFDIFYVVNLYPD